MDKPNLGYALGSNLKDKKDVRVTLKPMERRGNK